MKDPDRRSAPRTMPLDALLARLRVQLRELASFRDARRAALGPARFRAADGVEGSLAIGDRWPSRAWPVEIAFDVEIPEDYPESVALRLDVGGEGLLRVAGHTLGGLNPWHREYPLPDAAGRAFSVTVDTVPKAPFAVAVAQPTLVEAMLVVPDEDVRGLYEDLASVANAADALAETRSDLAVLLADAAAETLAGLDLPRGDAHAYLARLTQEEASRDLLETVWEEWRFQHVPAALERTHRTSIVSARGELAGRLARIRERYGTEGELWLSGHAHLDLAWLWPLAETRRKAQRTFRTVLGLLDRHPDWSFNQSMAQLYAWMAEDDPEGFAQIRERVAEGRWEVVGGMWVEPDGNLLAGESWARQLLVGQSWLERNLGTRATVAWLPDTFGYAGNLPQLLAQAGMHRFFTTKLNWNETNRFPHDLYWWEGIDGSRVLAHGFDNPKRNYNGMIGAEDTTDVWRRFRGKRRTDASLFTFGWGDGGGGPTHEMLERALRQREMPGLPHLVHARVDAFYAKVEAGAEADRLPVWVGEKYLEFHRGTYSTQAEIKRLHRRLEHVLVEAEAASALRWRLLDGDDAGGALEELWKVLLRNQFHDILPGSSVRTVNEEAISELTFAVEDAERIRGEALDALAALQTGGTAAGRGGRTEDGAILVWNLALEDRPLRAPVPVEAQTVRFEGRALPLQRIGDEIWVDAPDVMVPGMGRVALDVRTAASAESIGNAVVEAAADRLENAVLRVDVLSDGCVKVFDKELGRWAVDRPGNVLWAYPDIPRDFEAWEIDADHAAEGSRLAIVGRPRLVASGPRMAAVEVVRRGHGFEVVQEYRLWGGSRRLEFRTRLKATGRRTLLRTTFPTSVRSSTATYETAFGAVERPTHRNTSWDAAKFEVPGLRWADLSEPGYGVSLMSDAKYGYAAEGSALSLTLARGPVYPDPHADLGDHACVYALRPHPGDWRDGTVADAHDLNAPLVARSVRADPDRPTRLKVLEARGASVRLSALKRSEAGTGLVVRLYEPHGARGTAHLRGSLGGAAARLDLLEENRRVLADGGVHVGPFEVATVELG